MTWKAAYRSFYYEGAPEPEDLVLDSATTALLVIDIQNKYMAVPSSTAEQKRWAPFFDRMNNIARIACLKADGRDRSLSQKKPGWNYLLMPRTSEESQFVPNLAPRDDEIVLCKTTDSALTGTNLRLILRNMNIQNVVLAGIFTDQCVSSTVRSLADESFNVVVIEDCCAAGTDELHRRELEIINMIYCHVLYFAELREVMKI
jgi:nicotinamidase-related amidase